MFIKPNERDLLSLFGLVYPFIYILIVASLPLFFQRHKSIFFTLLFLSVCGIGSFSSYAKPSFAGQHKADDVTIMSFNAMMGFMLHEQPKAANGLSANDMLKSPEPDIIAIQEGNNRVISFFEKTLGYRYIHHLPKRGAMIISKFPIIQKGQVDFGPKLNSCLWADIRINKDTVRVYSFHLESNRLKPASYDFLAKEQYGSLDAINGLRDFATKYPTYARVRANQSIKMKKHINESPYPVIVCGDLNDPPVSFTYKTLKKGLVDTFKKTGGGFGTTWSGAIPMLRIDYIFASKNLKNTSYSCVESDFSDHYPVKASFNFKQEE